MTDSLRDRIFAAVKGQQRSHTATHLTDAVMAVLTTEDGRLARALFIHYCPLSNFDAETSWDSGKAARQPWIEMARNLIEEMCR